MKRVLLAVLILAGLVSSAEARVQPPPPLNVISVTELDLPAGMMNASAYLAPDGLSFAHLQGREWCRYSIDGEKGPCLDLQEQGIPSIDSETVRWSPDSRYLVFTPNFLMMFHEPDIWLLDAETWTVTNLTDDQIDASPLSEDYDQALVDLSPIWVDNGKRIAFVRYTGGSAGADTATMMSINPDGSDLALVGTVQTEHKLAVLSIERAPDLNWWAYNYFPTDPSAPEIGAWLAMSYFDAPTRLGAFEYTVNGETLVAPPWWLDFSPDVNYLMTYSDQVIGTVNALPTVEDGFLHADPAISPIRIFSVAGGQSFLADERYLVRSAGWSPEGQVLSTFAYIVYDRLLPEELNGLYISNGPGEEGRLVLPGIFIAPTSRGRLPLIWANNNTILLGSLENASTVIVQLGEEGPSPIATAENE